MQTELRRATMEVFLGVCLVISENILLALGLFTIHTHVLAFWICLGIIVLSEVVTQIVSLSLLKRRTPCGILCHVLQVGIIYRIVKLLTVEKKEFDKQVGRIHGLRLLRSLSGNLAVFSVLGLLILREEGSYVSWIPFLGLVAVSSITVANLTQANFLLALPWRLAEIAFRMTSLLVLALAYRWWSAMALVLHWTAMFLWCFTHDLLKTKRKYDNLKTILINFRSSLILCFCYADVRTMTSSKRTVAFYVIMVVENWILFAAWLLQSGLRHHAFIHVTVTMAVTSLIMTVCVSIHCLLKSRKNQIPKSGVAPQTGHQYTSRQTAGGPGGPGGPARPGLTPIAECDIYEELSDSPRSDDSGETSPGSLTRLVTSQSQAMTSQSQPMTSPITVYTIAGHKFKVVDGALEGVQYSADREIPRPRPLPQPNVLDSTEPHPYAITELVGQGRRPRSWSGKRGERSLSPEYETCGPASDSIYSSIPKVYHKSKLRPSASQVSHHRQSSESSGYDVTESDASFSSPSPHHMEREGGTSFTEVMDNLSKDSAICMAEDRLRVQATRPRTTPPASKPHGKPGKPGKPGKTCRTREPVNSRVCSSANSIFGESDFDREEYNTDSSKHDRRDSHPRQANSQEPNTKQVHFRPENLASTSV